MRGQFDRRVPHLEVSNQDFEHQSSSPFKGGERKDNRPLHTQQSPRHATMRPLWSLPSVPLTAPIINETGLYGHVPSTNDPE